MTRKMKKNWRKKRPGILGSGGKRESRKGNRFRLDWAERWDKRKLPRSKREEEQKRGKIWIDRLMTLTTRMFPTLPCLVEEGCT